MTTKPSLPPLIEETAIQKIRMAEDAWNSRNLGKIVLVYTEDTEWRNHNEFPVGRDKVNALLTHQWQKELDYRLIKELWAYTDNISQCALPMSGMMILGNTIAPMVMKIGSLTSKA